MPRTSQTLVLAVQLSGHRQREREVACSRCTLRERVRTRVYSKVTCNKNNHLIGKRGVRSRVISLLCYQSCERDGLAILCSSLVTPTTRSRQHCAKTQTHHRQATGMLMFSQPLNYNMQLKNDFFGIFLNVCLSRSVWWCVAVLAAGSGAANPNLKHFSVWDASDACGISGKTTPRPDCVK